MLNTTLSLFMICDGSPVMKLFSLIALSRNHLFPRTDSTNKQKVELTLKHLRLRYKKTY